MATWFILCLHCVFQKKMRTPLLRLQINFFVNCGKTICIPRYLQTHTHTHTHTYYKFTINYIYPYYFKHSSQVQIWYQLVILITVRENEGQKKRFLYTPTIQSRYVVQEMIQLRVARGKQLWFMKITSKQLKYKFSAEIQQ